MKIFLIITCCMSVHAYDETMLVDLITSFKGPKTVIGVTCWPMHKKVRFSSKLANQQIMMTYNNSTNISDTQKQQIIFLLDLNCDDTWDYLISNKNIIQSPYRWIIIDNISHGTYYDNIEMADMNVPVDTEAVVISQPASGHYDIYYVYRIGSNGIWIKENYGTWSPDGLKLYNMTLDVAPRRRNLHGYELGICYVLTNNDSINHLTDRQNDYIDTITKVNFPTTNHLVDYLNASRRYLYTETWGYRQANNTWSGLTGYLARDEVDIGGSPMFFTSERLSIVEYISSPTPTRSKFVFQQPKLSYENNLFLLSFQESLWYGSSALVCLTFLVLFIVAVWEWKITGTDNEKRIKNAGILRPNIIDVALLTFGATCQQGSPVELKGSLGRMVLLLLFVALTFLYTSFSANIVALLQSSSSEIKTLSDLLNSRIKFGVHDTVFNRYYFSTETEAIRRAIYEKKVAPPGAVPRFISMEDGIKEMRKGLFAFHMEIGVGYKFVGKYFEEGEKCGLKEIQYLRVIDPWLAVRKDTPFMEMFKIGTKRLQEHGLQQRENHLLYQKRPKCSGRQASFVSVSMVDCYPALLVLSYGALAAIFVAIAEVLISKKYKVTKLHNHTEVIYGDYYESKRGS